ncbi:hypothetical protein L3X38_022403 [Prunus dulcis]|uniref:60S ribosomal protein L27 n=1 Tax=Prunus dulcis TaxID=3755 RepID=A0AAD4Z4K0_PRUDU|nr:hypothetical protein L3X38_022403 [Prunus dulcis]
MVKFLKANKAVVSCRDDTLAGKPKDSAKKTAKKSRVKAFVKLVNYQHVMPTRYNLDVDLKEVLTVDALQTRDKKVAAKKEIKARLEDRFKSGKNRWFFTKLRF